MTSIQTNTDSRNSKPPKILRWSLPVNMPSPPPEFWPHKRIYNHTGQFGSLMVCNRHLKQDDTFNRTWWSVLSIDKLVTWQHLSIERTGGHVVLKASSFLRSPMRTNRRLRTLVLCICKRFETR